MEGAWNIGAAVAVCIAGLEVAKAAIHALRDTIRAKKNGRNGLNLRPGCPVHGECLGSAMHETMESQAASAEKSEHHLASIARNMAIVLQNQRDEKGKLEGISQDTQWLKAMDEARRTAKARGPTGG
jgi:hypothetical protein